MEDDLLNNLFANLANLLPEEAVEVLASNSQVRIERIVSTGHSSPKDFWYDQEEHEWVALLRGAAKLRFDDGEVLELQPGDHVLITAHRRHRVEWTSPDEPTLWLAVFYRD